MTVMFWHWVFFEGTQYGGQPKQISPLPVLFPFYEKGFKAVDLFFTISGFVFFFMYMDMIRGGKITASRFFVLRFSRLYPLHLLSLMLVIAAAWYESIHLSSFVYRFNDLKHFILNLLLLQSWGMESGESFNGPSWSISVEAFLYCVFFVFALRVRIGFIGTWLIALSFLSGWMPCTIPSPGGWDPSSLAARPSWPMSTSPAMRAEMLSNGAGLGGAAALDGHVPLDGILVRRLWRLEQPGASPWIQKAASFMSKVWPNMVLFPSPFFRWRFRRTG
jgi:peptidoglycan/LPS O-acetylase OafA/YrhL